MASRSNLGKYSIKSNIYLIITETPFVSLFGCDCHFKHLCCWSHCRGLWKDVCRHPWSSRSTFVSTLKLDQSKKYLTDVLLFRSRKKRQSNYDCSDFRSFYTNYRVSGPRGFTNKDLGLCLARLVGGIADDAQKCCPRCTNSLEKYFCSSAKELGYNTATAILFKVLDDKYNVWPCPPTKWNLHVLKFGLSNLFSAEINWHQKLKLLCISNNG